MKGLAVGAVIILSLAGLAIDAYQAQDVTKPSWVVIFRFDPADEQLGQTLELRTVVRAGSEGEAAMRAVLFVQRYIAVTDVEKLRFVEAQEKK